jgi:hypothetical protein
VLSFISEEVAYNPQEEYIEPHVAFIQQCCIVRLGLELFGSGSIEDTRLHTDHLHSTTDCSSKDFF